MAPNHWHYLSPQRLWGFPKAMPHVKVRAEFMSNIQDPSVTAYIWFLCNGHGGPGHFVQVGIGAPHVGNGPVEDGDRPIPRDVMVRLQDGFDHWFNWRPVSFDEGFQEELRRIPAPVPTFIPTLRRVTPGHSSLPAFEALLDGEDQRHLRQRAVLDTLAQQPQATFEAAANPANEAMAVEKDMANFRRETTNPNSEGFVYLIHMQGTAYHKIGMSLDPQLRLRTLQTGNPHLLQVLVIQSVQNMRSAEASLHRLFERQRVPNVHATEWFDFGSGTNEVQAAFSAIS